MFSFGKNKEQNQNLDSTHTTNTRDNYQDASSSQTSLAIDGRNGGNLELKIAKPVSFSEVTTVADYLLNNNTVFLDLEAASPETIRRILDFLTGVSYAAKCSMQKVSPTTFIFTPQDVDVREEGIGE